MYMSACLFVYTCILSTHLRVYYRTGIWTSVRRCLFIHNCIVDIHVPSLPLHVSLHHTPPPHTYSYTISPYLRITISFYTLYISLLSAILLHVISLCICLRAYLSTHAYCQHTCTFTIARVYGHLSAVAFSYIIVFWIYRYPRCHCMYVPTITQANTSTDVDVPR